MHDIGKLLIKITEGTHTEPSVELTKKYGESDSGSVIASHHEIYFLCR